MYVLLSADFVSMATGDRRKDMGHLSQKFLSTILVSAAL